MKYTAFLQREFQRAVSDPAHFVPGHTPRGLESFQAREDLRRLAFLCRVEATELARQIYFETYAADRGLVWPRAVTKIPNRLQQTQIRDFSSK